MDIQVLDQLRRTVSTLLAVTLGLVVAGAVVVAIVLPRAVHGEAMTVLTGSMEPSIPTGSLALVRPVDPRTVQSGDVITYQVRAGEDVYVTHRVVSVDEEGGQTLFTLQGDANDVADEPILGDRIRGEVWFHVPHLGAVRDALHGRGGVTLVGTLLLGWFAWAQLSAGLRERSAGRRSPAPSSTTRTDRPVVVVELVDRRLRGLGQAPDEAAAALGGTTLRSGSRTTTVLVSAVRGETEADLLARVEVLRPRAVHVVATGSDVTTSGVAETTDAETTADEELADA